MPIPSIIAVGHVACRDASQADSRVNPEGLTLQNLVGINRVMEPKLKSNWVTLGSMLLGICGALGDEVPYLVEDLISGATQNGSGFDGGVAMGGFIYFPATTDEHGEELWRTDGIPGGTTELVKDIWPGVDSSDIQDMWVVGTTLFFSANDGVHGWELWMSDGTPGGTVLAADINPGAGHGSPRNIYDVNGDAVFTAVDGTTGRELWIYDMSESQASQLLDIRPGAQGSMTADFTFFSRYFGMFDGKLYFSADDGSKGFELWVTDGTPTGTTMVKDINPTGTSGAGYSITVLGNYFYFSASDGTSGGELWRSDGTEGGTTRVKDIQPGANSSNPTGITVLGSLLIFAANDGTTGVDLWISDGTEGGTQGLDINPGSGGSSPNDFVVAGGHVVFEAFDAVFGSRVLWKSDGTGPGTATLGSTPVPTSGGLTPLDSNTVLFSASQQAGTGFELWKGNIAENTIELVKDIFPGSNGSLPGSLTRMYRIGSEVFFSASEDNSSTGDPDGELWKTDGTEVGTVKVADINESPRSGDPIQLATLGNRVLFTTKGVSTFNQRFLYASDGTVDGVVEVKELSIWRRIQEIIPFGNIAFLVVANTESGVRKFELWKTDGTTAGTVQVHNDIGDYSTSGSNPPVPGEFTVVGNRIFFATTLADSGRELWVSNGTTAGTKMVADIRPGTSGSSPSFLVAFKNKVYFRASHSGSTATLWRSDGTEAGTEQVPYGGITFPSELTVVGDTLFYVASFDPPGGDFYTDREIWKSDGTEAGTMLLKDIWPGLDPSFASRLTSVGTTLFFTATDGTHGVELWKSDGTDGGTMMVEDIVPGPNGSSPTELTNVADTLFFVVNDGIHGLELWSSDGTAVGTDLLKDTRLGTTAGDGPQELTAVGPNLFFRGGNDGEGEELWRSDGTPVGTVSFDINAGPAWSSPTEFAHTFNRLFFSATESATGRELWAIPVTIPVPDNRAPGQRITSRGGRVKEASYDLAGVANDNIGVARVEVTLNGGPPVDAPLGAPGSRGNIPFSLDGMALENGINEIVVTTFDLGGNTSRSSTLIVNFLSNRPAIAGNYLGLLLPDAAVTPDNDNTGLLSLRVTRSGVFTGRVTLGRYSLPVRGILDNTGHARFFVRGIRATSGLPMDQALTRRVNRNLTINFGMLAFEVDAGLIEGTLRESGSGDLVSTLDGARGHFHPRSPRVPDSYLLNRGRFTAHFPAEATQPSLTAADYPQGTGVATANVLPNGRVVMRGVLADGTRFACAALLSETLAFPLFAKLYLRGGALAGHVQLDELQPETDLFGDSLLWLRPENTRAKHYPDGWPGGIALSILGAKYQRPVGASVMPGLGADDFDGDGNAELTFTDGLLSAPVTQTLNIDSRNRVRNVPTTRDFLARIVVPNGMLGGNFVHSDGFRTPWTGVIHQKGSAPGGVGFFLSVVPRNATETGQSGEVMLVPE